MAVVRGIVGIILAGGLSRRMGGREKSLLEIAGRPLAAHVAERLAPQVDRLVVNANGDPARFGALGLPVVPDSLPGNPGPLAGIAAGMNWARQNHPATSHVLSMPADTPFFPSDLRERLRTALPSAHAIAIARSNGRLHGACGLWPVEVEARIAQALAEGRNKVLDLVESSEWVAVDFDATAPAAIDPFFNINTSDDLERARALVAQTGPEPQSNH
jgi:molybdopterin-guanine dinucleotide biosynthesis protein A